MSIDHDSRSLLARIAALPPQKRAQLERALAARKTKAPAAAPGLPVVVAQPEARFEAFELTEVQQAYWIGRAGGIELGNVACHVYAEQEPGYVLDLPRFRKVWQRLIQRHDMLRVVMGPDGKQRVLAEVPELPLEVIDLRTAGPQALAEGLGAVRSRMSHQVRPADQWPLYEVVVARLPGDRVRLHMSWDVLVGDSWSWNILFREFALLYADPDAALPPLTLTFRDYVLAAATVRDTPLYDRARAYWIDRIGALPPGPQLPLAQLPATLHKPRFAQRRHRLAPQRWRAIKALARQHGLTPAMVLLRAYADVLAAWSKDDHFTLNLTLFSRLPLHQQVDDIVGDFTSLTLLEIDPAAGGFVERVRQVQARLWSDLDHRHMGGVEVMREVMRASGSGYGAVMPVVFTCGLRITGDGADDDSSARDALGEVVYSVSQTPQVWLDHQVAELGGGLQVNWDAVEALFGPGMLDAMFAAFIGILERLADDPSAWQAAPGGLTPPADRALIDVANATAGPRPQDALHAPFFARAKEAPERVAVITEQRTFSYGEVADEAHRIASALRRLGARGNTLVAVVMDKGPEQISAVLGILASGAAYVPIDASLPKARIEHLLADAETELVVTQSWLAERFERPVVVGALAPADPIEVASPAPDDLAYVIYTSGSSGKPKGVMIEHAAAMNTIADVNHRFDVGPDDRVLAVSALSFDLSVYDVFGALAAGAAIVLPEASGWRDPAHWSALMLAHRVTIWSSVPTLMAMLVEHSEGRQSELHDALRVVMLSGDWIGVSLPDRIRALAPNASVTSLGGATEASIWSILHPIEDVDPSWTSIPYGKAMRNQAFYVLDRQLEPRPVWVPGDLYIGGVGLARGYWRDQEKTAASFVTRAADGVRLYRTGDLGRLLPDGSIEFLGRQDNQVKVRGHRIELGEIEAALEQHAGVERAVVEAIGDGAGRRLAAFVVVGADSPLLEAVAPPIDLAWPQPPAEAFADPDEADASAFDQVAVGLMARALGAGGAFAERGEVMATGEVIERCRVQPRYHKLVRRWLDTLVQAGLLAATGEQLSSTSPLLAADVALDEVADSGLRAFLARLQTQLPGVLAGDLNPLEVLFPGGSTALMDRLYGSADSTHAAAAAWVGGLAAGWAADRPLRVLEVFAGTGGTTAHVLDAIRPSNVTYTFSERSRFFTARAEQTFAGVEGMRYRTLDLERDPLQQGFGRGGFDVVIGRLHATADIGQALAHVATLLAPGGVLLLEEQTRWAHLFSVTIGLLEAMTAFADDRLAQNHPFLHRQAWRAALAGAGFSDIVVQPESEATSMAVIGARLAAAAPRGIETQRARAHLGTWLPDYMIPEVYVRLDALPLTANGKVDRRALVVPESAALVAGALAPPANPTEAALVQIWAEVLDLDEVGVLDDLISLGGDSLIAVQLMSRVRARFSVDLPLATLFAAPTVRGQAQAIAAAACNRAALGDLPEVRADVAGRFEPFGLTDVQQAYWIGRTGGFELGNVACHLYVEYEALEIDVDRFAAAWRQIIDRHDMLRMVVDADGRQRVLEHVPPFSVRLYDWSAASAADAEAGIAKIRGRMSHEVRPTDRWPLYDLAVSQLPDRVRLHISWDIMVADAWSWNILLGEVAWLYADPAAALPPLAITFRDYLLAERSLQAGPRYDQAKAYWMDRLPALPPAPQLPLAAPPSSFSNPRFERRSRRIEAGRWGKIKARARQAGLTPAMALLTAYADVLGAWSRSRRFCLNLTLFSRYPLHPDVDRLVGDFTSLTILEIDAGVRDCFEARARVVQARLWADLDHRLMGGVQVMRELARQHPDIGAVMPVVFTCGLRMTGDGAGETAAPAGLGEVVYALSQTPQVWLDHQVIELGGALQLNWDSVEGLFPPGLLDDAFAAYVDCIERLADDEAAWTGPRAPLMPPAQAELQAAANATAVQLPTGLLHRPFVEQAVAAPDAIALVCGDVRLTYGALLARSAALAHELVAAGAAAGRTVAIVMDRGWQQVVAALGVLMSGATYVPIDGGAPRRRIAQLIEDAAAFAVVTQPGLALDDMPALATLVVGAEVPAIAEPPEVETTAGDLAYVIYTSGSSGAPKGVMITHGAARNTIEAINRRFAVTAADSVLAVSSLTFDLSVYDLFGVLAAGGRIVLPDAAEARDPARWAALMARESVTVWSSAPQLMQLLVDHLEGWTDLEALIALRLVMLSGDWIAVTLPDRIRARRPGVQVVSLGGATEASIWSIAYPIERTDPSWSSIPYGKPLANQRFLVLGDDLEPQPVWVPGQLHIGGAGLAEGYFGDPARTAASFFEHPRTGERLYRTGDLGRWLPDGNLEFLGREDLQVKVHGYRVELGEIEAVLSAHPEVEGCAVTAFGPARGPLRLVAYVVGDADSAALATHLAESLPAYMVPSAFVKLDALPLSPNGKLDRKQLPEPGDRGGAQGPAEADEDAPVPQSAERIAAIVAEVLELDGVDASTSLMSLGVSSVEVIRIANRLERELAFRPKIADVYRSPTVAGLARLYEAKAGADSGPVQIILDADERARFKRRQLGRRAFGEDRRVVLAATEAGATFREQRSFRRFSAAPVALETLGRLLGCLRQTELDGYPKYLYPSAGGSYPVQVYLHVADCRVEGLDGGTYYHDPKAHGLVPLVAGAEIPPEVHDPFVNRGIHASSAFSIFLVAAMDAIEPLYGAESRDFCLLEAGAMCQLLRQHAPQLGLGLCQIGGLDFAAVRQHFDLSQRHQIVHSLVGGAIDAQQLERWSPTEEVFAGEAAALPALAPLPEGARRHGPLRLSPAQERLWFLDRLAPGSAVYNIAGAVRIRAPVDQGRLAFAIDEVVGRHEVLRTTFDEVDGVPAQVVHAPSHQPLPTEAVDGWPAAIARATQLARVPFDLQVGPLLRFQLLRLDPSDHVLVIVVHHTVADGWSMQRLAHELAELYTGGVLPELAIQYADYAAWQHVCLDAAVSAKQLSYWRGQLAGLPPLVLPTDRARPAVQSLAGATLGVRFARGVYDALIQGSKDLAASPFMVLLAAWSAVLARHSGQRDIAVGAPVARRHREEIEPLIGLFVNTLVMRTDVDLDAPFAALVAQVKEVALAAYDNQDVPFEHLVDVLQVERDLSRAPLFDVMLVLQEAPEEAVRSPLMTEMVALDTGTSKFDLSLSLTTGAGGLTGTLEYSTDLFDRGTVERLVGHLEGLLCSGLADPARAVGRLPWLQATERAQLQAWCTGPALPQGDLLWTRLLRRADEAPDSIALVADDATLTYAELVRQANAVAGRLIAEGVRPEQCVGVRLERSARMVVAVLGVMRAGAAYVPLDPAYPEARIQFIVEDAGLEVIVDAAWFAADGPPDADVSAPAIDGASLAYVIYTSGSTGKPKGAEISHGALANLLTAMASRVDVSADTVWLAVTSLSFDIAALELYLPLVVGGRVHVAPQPVTADGQALAARIDGSGATIVQATPATWRLLAEAGWSPQPGLQVLCGGEALPRDLLPYLGDRAWNVYGPTETTIWSMAWRVDRSAAKALIGLPLANTTVYVLDPAGAQAPIGVAGELFIGGAGLARGYHRRPALTAARFVERGGERLYRTGDLVRWRADGNLEFLRRVDQQIKLRGHRIELEEIEAVLQRHPAVRACAVEVRDETLVAHVVPAAEPPSFEVLTAHLAAQLPKVMVPSAVRILEALPMTPNGKLDRAALAAIGVAEAAPQRAVPPRSSTERALAGIWSALLERASVGVHDDFFAVGGHSLLAAQLVAQIDKRLGVEVPLRAVFERPTIAALAAAIDTGMVGAGDEPDWQLEVVLPQDIAPRVPARCGAPRSVLLTGATGFLGAFLVDALLRRTDADVYCLVRAPDRQRAQVRLQAVLQRYGIELGSAANRVHVLCGDFSKPGLDLDAASLTKLRDRVDAVVHNGAQVSFLSPYAGLRRSNVLGTVEVLRLAAEAGAAVHFVSTISVFGLGSSVVDEAAALPPADVLHDGYAQSKWVAEKLVLAAGDRGLPVRIYRPGRIAGHSETGALNRADFFFSVLRGCLELGMAPDADAELDLTPVDYVAAAIAQLVGNPSAASGPYHLVNPVRARLRDLLDVAAVSRVPFARWKAAALDHVSADPSSALAPFAPLIEVATGAEILATSEPRFGQERTAAALDGSGVRCPTDHRALLGRYLSWLSAAR